MPSDDAESMRVPKGNGTRAGNRTMDITARVAAMRADFLDFYDHEHPLVVRFMIRSGASLHEAEDAAQEAFLDAWKCSERHPRQWEEIRNRALWIRIVARNKLRGSSRSRDLPTVAVAEVPARTSSVDHADLTARTLDVLAALQELDEEARTVMALCMDGHTCGELAQALEIKEQKVRDTLRRARKALAEKLSTATTPRRRPNR